MGHNWTYGVLTNSKAKLGSRLVLYALAESADIDSGESYPSVKTIAARANISERAAQYCLRNLEELGEIKRLPGVSQYQTYRYKINRNLLTKGVQILQGANIAGVQTTTENMQDFAPNMSFKPSKNKKARANGYSETFSEFWERTIKIGSKSKAQDSWEKLSDEERIDVLGVIDQWTAYYNDPGVWEKMVVTWLNQRMWESRIPKIHVSNGKPQQTLLSEREYIDADGNIR